MGKECFLTRNLIAHRGLHDGNQKVIENTLEAFNLACEKKYIIELDIHILKDNQIIVFHDDNTQRLTDINIKLSEVTYDDIKALKLKNSNSHIPKLEEVFNLVAGRVPILIEIKDGQKVGRLEENLVKILDNYKGEVAVKSFNPFVVKWFKDNRPNIIRGQLAAGFKKDNLYKRIVYKNMLFNFITKPDFISYAVADLSFEKARKIRKNKLLLGWTVRTEEQKEKYIKEYDNLICENIL